MEYDNIGTQMQPNVAGNTVRWHS